LWPNPTEEEKLVAQLLLSMMTRWMGYGCLFEPESEIALRLMEFHDRLCSYSSEKDLAKDVRYMLPALSYPISGDDLDFNLNRAEILT